MFQVSSDRIAENYNKLSLDQQAFVKSVANTVSEKSDEVADCRDRTLGLQQAKDAEKVSSWVLSKPGMVCQMQQQESVFLSYFTLPVLRYNWCIYDKKWNNWIYL